MTLPNRPAFSLCICPDSRLLQTRLEALAAEHPAPGGWQRHVFWADEGLGPSFWEHLTLQGLFAASKILIVRNAQSLPAENLRTLCKALLPLAGSPGAPLPSPLLWPMLCLEVGLEKGKAKLPAHVTSLPCYILAEQRGWIDCAPGLTPASLPGFIRAEAMRQGLALSPREVNLLTESLAPDAAHVVSEIGKLALLADARGKLPDKLDALAGQSREIGMFEIIRLVQQNRNAPAVWKQILEDKLTGENMVFAFSSLVLREARILWQSLSGATVALPHQVAVQKKIMAEALGHAGIARIWDLALQADKGVKTGERTPDQAFAMLAADLFRLFSHCRQD